MRLLTLDGGGVKGVMIARLIQRLQEATPFLDHIDVFAGTSTGGIISLALAAEVPLDEIVSIYETHASTIFKSRGLLDTLAGGLDEYVRADFGQDGLRSVLKEVFGDLRLPDLAREVLIPSFDLTRFKPKFLDRTDNWSVVDAALATAAAPTYFPVHLVCDMDKGGAKPQPAALIDGGVFCNNPARAAIDYARNNLGATIIRVLSLGAGQKPYAPPEEALSSAKKVLDWGIRQWLVSNRGLLLKVLMDGSVVAVHYSAKGELGELYHRIQPGLPEDVDLADHTKVPLLKAIADAHELDDAIAWLKLNMGITP